MTVIELLAQLREKNVELSIKGDDLVVRAKERALDSPELLARLRENKKALVDLIKAGKYVGPKGLVHVPSNLIPAGCDAITPEMLPLVDLTPEEIDRIVSATPGGAANVQDIYPLVPLQEGILFHHLMATEGDPYLLNTLCGFDTRARLDAFLQALRFVIERHDALRTSVLWEGLSEPVQVVWRHAPLVVEEVSLDPAAGDIAEQLRARFNPRHYRIDIRNAPMMRVFIAHDALNDHWVMVALYHHLSVEGASLNVMLEEVREHLLGRSDQLPAPLPFRNFVARSRLGVNNDEHEEFFRKMLGDVDEPTAPFGLIDARGDGSGIREARRGVDVLLVRRLRQRAQALGLSVASLCHLAWAMALARVSTTVSGRDDVVFGTAVFGRMRDGDETRRMLGVFINTLPVRVRVGSESAQESARQIHSLLLRLLYHEHASLTLAQRSSGVAPPAPLFSALLNYRHGAVETSSQTPGSAGASQVWEGIEFQGGLEQRTNYPVTMQVDDLGATLILNALTQSPIEPERVCAYMHTALDRLAEALEFAPSSPVESLDVMPAAERRQLLVDWNATAADYPRNQLIHELFEARVIDHPEADAVEQGDSRLTYGELNVRANRLARYLRKLGVQPDSRVGLCVERSPDMVVGILAILKAGGAYVPLDPEYPAERLTYMLADSAPAAVLTHAEANARAQSAIRLALAESAGKAPLIDLDADAARWANQPGSNPDRTGVGLRPEHLAYVIYTSGSTGRPKGVMVEHRGLSNYLCWAAKNYELERGSVVSSSLSFDATITSLLTPLIYGSVVRLLPIRKEVDGLEEQVRGKEGCGLVKITPTHLDALGRRLKEERASASVSMFVIGGEELSPSTVEMWREIQPGARMVNEYGPTETVVGCVAYEIPQDHALKARVPIGRPISNTQIYLLDKRLRPAPIGVVGEIYIGGEGVARGYLNQPELTAEHFIELRIEDEGWREKEGAVRVYKTGDLGRYLPDGTIEFVGRNDSQVKIRGYRIELGEIESVLLRHPEVSEAVAVAREDESGEKQLVAYYTVKKPGASVEAETLREHLLTALPERMTPAAYVELESLPVTPNGKVDRQALPAVGAQSYATAGYEAPIGEIETVLARIWAEALKQERIGRHDNFFALGGHSLMAIKVASRIRQMLSVEIGVSEFFDHPVLREFAEKVGNASRSELPPITIIPRDQPLPLSFAQQRLWFLAQMEGISQAYHLPLGLRLTGQLNLDALGRALDRLVARHEALRTTFISIDGQPVQRIAPEDSGFTMVRHDLGLRGDAEQELERLAAEEATAPFNLETGPLVRGRLIRLNETEHALLITMHHIISDGWSLGVLTNELSALYLAYSQDQADPLPKLALQYADYAAWQRRWIAGDALRAQAEYWANTLAGAPAFLSLPTDRPRAIEQDRRGAFLELELPERLTSDVKAFSQQRGTTLFMTLLAAWAALLGRLAGQDDVVIGIPVANRTRAEIEPLIGFFVNTLALRLNLSGGPTARQFLRHTKEQALAAQERQDLPFEQVVEIVNPARSLSHSPLFQVMFVWQNTEAGELELPGLTLEPVSSSYDAAKFDLTLNLTDLGGRIVGGLEYSTALFDRGTIERHGEYLRNMLQAMVENDEQSIELLPLLTPAERHRLLVEWNATREDYRHDRCVHELFEEQASARPEAIAISHQDRHLCYGELNARSNRLAAHLRFLGLRQNARVALCVERSIDMVIGMLAVLKAGAAYAPLDSAYPAERLAYMIEEIAPFAILSDGRFRALEHPALGAVTASVPVIDLQADAERWDSEPETNPDRASLGLTPRNAAYVIYTSGSTGRPKGTVIEHRSLCNEIMAMRKRYELDADDRILQFVSIAFDVSAEDIFSALASGATLELRTDAWLNSVGDFVTWLRMRNITSANLPAIFWEQLIRDDGAIIPAQVRRVSVGGEAISSQSMNAWARRSSYGQQLFNVYGPTETTICAAQFECAADVEGAPPIGRPIANTRIYILDSHGVPVPTGVTGELFIGGAGVARGYLNRPDLTAERFIPDPFTVEETEVRAIFSEHGSRMYRTGDLARRLPTGDIEFVGRNDFQVKIRGFRIELSEIETRLMEHPSIQDAIVLAREDTAGDKRLVAYYTLMPELSDSSVKPVTADTLRAFLSSVLPEYMEPSAYIPLHNLPLASNGKLDRDALPAPDAESYASHGYVAPEGETEMTLAGMWADLLKIERIGRHDNFFDLGGHSLLMMKLVSRIQAEFGVRIAIQDFFRSPSLTSLARLVLHAQLAQFAPEEIDALVNRL